MFQSKSDGQSDKRRIAIGKRKFAGAYFLPPFTEENRIEGGRRIGSSEVKESTKDRPLVSIVTVTMNAAETLQQTINSVYSQTYDNIEHIIIDGGSTDLTLSIIHQNIDKIEYFVSENDSGIYNAMNKGIALSQGDYICLLNADDSYSEDYIQKAIDVARGEDADIIYSGFRASGVDNEALDPDDGLFLGHLNINHETFLVKSKCYDQIGKYDESLRIVSDSLWIRKAYEQGLKFCKVPGVHLLFSEEGLSAGTNVSNRELFILEYSNGVTERFEFLSHLEAEQLYLFRFNKWRSYEFERIIDRYSDRPDFMFACAGYWRYCIQSRENFVLSAEELDGLLPVYIEICDRLGVSLDNINAPYLGRNLGEVLHSVDELRSEISASGKTVHLHFASVYSRPSETFIYDFIQNTKAAFDITPVVICQHRLMMEDRPEEFVLQLPLEKYLPVVRSAVLSRFLSSLNVGCAVFHFSINASKFIKMLDEAELSLPCLVMNHGLDVHKMFQDPEFRSYIVDDLSHRTNVWFTAPTDYLASELVRAGVNAEKVSILHNTVRPRFFSHRKSNEYYSGEGPLKILSVGRLVPFKGHEYFIKAIALLKQADVPCEAKIVYGNDASLLDRLTRIINANGLQNQVELVEFVDFEKEPEYFSKFDLFISSSTVDKNTNQAETFGVSTLEAIIAGLPVIVTNAGGSPEVVGANGTWSKIVDHASARSIHEGVMEFLSADFSPFSDNSSYAEQRMSHFSVEKQMSKVSTILEHLGTQRTKVAVFSTFTHGGAGAAGFRSARAMRKVGLDAKLFLPSGAPNADSKPLNDAVRIDGTHGNHIGKSFKTKHFRDGYTIFDLNEHRTKDEELAEKLAEYDIVNLHWVSRFISVQNIAALSRSSKPVILTIRDMHFLSGGCHYFHGCEKWKSACESCPQVTTSVDDNYPSYVFDYKKENWNFQNITVVVLSTISKEIVEQSPLFKNCRIELIPNWVDTDKYVIKDRNEARQHFGLSETSKVILYAPSFHSKVKGRFELFRALKQIRRKHPEHDYHLLTIGNDKISSEDCGLPVLNTGYLMMSEELAMAYSAADVTVLPSLEETFSNTAAESLACGTPIVGFKSGAIPDLANNGEFGEVVDVGDVTELANAIHRVASSDEIDRTDCRKHVETNYSQAMHGRKYQQLFDELLQQTERHSEETTTPVSKIDNNDVLLESAFIDQRYTPRQYSQLNNQSRKIKLKPGNSLEKGEVLASSNGNWLAQVTENGLIVYSESGALKWSSGPLRCHAERLKLTHQGNLVLENCDGAVLWSSQTSLRNAKSQLNLNDHGDLELIGLTDNSWVAWSSNGKTAVAAMPQKRAVETVFEGVRLTNAGHGWEQPTGPDIFELGFWSHDAIEFTSTAADSDGLSLEVQFSRVLAQQSVSLLQNGDHIIDFDIPEVQMREQPETVCIRLSNCSRGDKFTLTFSEVKEISKYDAKLSAALVSRIALIDTGKVQSRKDVVFKDMLQRSEEFVDRLSIDNLRVGSEQKLGTGKILNLALDELQFDGLKLTKASIQVYEDENSFGVSLRVPFAEEGDFLERFGDYLAEDDFGKYAKISTLSSGSKYDCKIGSEDFLAFLIALSEQVFVFSRETVEKAQEIDEPASAT